MDNPVVELENYTVKSVNLNTRLEAVQFTLHKGDVYAIHTEVHDESRLLLRALATLAGPVSGIYRFNGRAVDFSDYRTLLPVKRRIGYIASDSALIRSVSVEENLLMMRHYFEDSFHITQDDSCGELCDTFHIQDKMDLYPEDLSPLDYQMAVTVREFSKSPDILLLERPENLMGHAGFHSFLHVLDDMRMTGIPVVMVSFDKTLVQAFSGKQLRIENGRLVTYFNRNS